MLPIWLVKALGPLIYEVSPLYLGPIIILIFFRVLFLLIDAVNLLLHSSSAPEPNRKSYTRRDVSIVCLIDVDDDLEDFLAAILSWQMSNVAAAIVVVPRASKNYGIALSALSNLTTLPYRLLTTTNDHPLLTGCNNVTTPLIALSPPFLIWSSPSKIEWLLVPLDQPDIGLVAPSVELQPSNSGQLNLKELAFDMILSQNNAQLQAYDAFSATLHSLPDVSLIRTSILQDSLFQNTISFNQTVSDSLWRWIIRSRWDFAFQKSEDCFVSIRCPKAWSRLLAAGQYRRRLRRAGIVLSGGIWRRHSLLAIRILLDVLEMLLILYLICCLVLIPILKPTWPILTLAMFVTMSVLAGNLVSIVVYWGRHPIDLIYLPLYLCLNLARFWSQLVPVSARSRQLESSCDAMTMKISETEKKDPVIRHHHHIETYEAASAA